MTEQTILIVEDEPSIADNVKLALSAFGYQVIWCQFGRDALPYIEQGAIDLVVLDVGLPDINGFELCKQIRQICTTPILFLTARAEEIDRVVGFEIGGDDYVTKPFSPRELVARIGAILKRCQPATTTQSLNSNPFFVDHTSQQVKLNQQKLDLTHYELGLLIKLLSQPERVFSREQLLSSVWREPENCLDRVVDTHIKGLRAKLRTVDANNDYIQTHRGLGYSVTLRPPQ